MKNSNWFSKNTEDSFVSLLLKFNLPLILLWLGRQFIDNQRIETLIIGSIWWMTILYTAMVVFNLCEFISGLLRGILSQGGRYATAKFLFSFKEIIAIFLLILINFLIFSSNDNLYLNFWLIAPKVWTGTVIFWIFFTLLGSWAK